jgi:hypothetical protein
LPPEETVQQAASRKGAAFFSQRELKYVLPKRSLARHW